MSFEAEMRVFVEVVRHRCFARAAEKLHISRPSTSRLFKAFEERFAPRLAHRTPQRVELLPQGRSIYDKAEAIVVELDELMSMCTDEHKGTRLTISCTPELAFGLLDCAVESLAQATPSIDVELLTSPADPHATPGVVDATVGFEAPLAKERLVVQPLAEEKFVLVAARDAVALHGKPASFPELSQTRFIWFGDRAAPVRWKFARRRDHWEELELTPTVADLDCSFLVNAVKKGLGVGILPNWLAAAPIAAGELVQALPGWHVASTLGQRQLQVHIHPLSSNADAMRKLVEALKGFLTDAPAAPPRVAARALKGV